MNVLRKSLLTVLPYLQHSLFRVNFRVMQMLHSKYSKRDWDDQFRRGHWDYLLQPNQISRLSVVAGYCDFFARGGSILEVGCGNGGLPQRLGAANYSKYTGIDISSVAVELASANANEKNRFICTDAMTYSPSEKYDVIAFNECLNYFDDPLWIIQRYNAFLTYRGVFVVSMYENLKAKSIWKLIEPSCDIKDMVVLVRPVEKTWHRISAFTVEGRP